MSIEPSLPSCKAEGFFVAPKAGIVMEGSLKLKTEQIPLLLADKREQKGQNENGSDEGVKTSIPFYRQSSWSASTLHLRIQSFPCDSKQESLVNQTAACTRRS